jgi:RimJ/RimL family protein N-acetyltransferase
MKIETERLILYPISNQEMESLIENENDAELKQAYSEMLQGCINEPENRIWYAVWLMELKNHSGTIVGDFCFKGLCADGMVEIGYGLREGFCGKGYMTEALKAITAWALAQSGVTRVEAETDPENKASQKVLAVCGFIPTGTIGEEGPRFVFKDS